jgi:uncharacterized protein YjbI with pentapeptide repeats
VGTVFVIAGLGSAVVIAGSLLCPVPKRWAERATSLAFWRRKSIYQRFQRRRPLALTYLGLAGVAVIVLVIWVVPTVLTEAPHIDSPSDRHKAINDTRTGLVAILAAIGAAGGLAYTARTYRLSRAGQITDRYSKAVEQLGDEKIEVRLGGIYALERLMHDSAADQPTIMETFAAFVRQHAPPSSRPALPARGTPPPIPKQLAEDVQAVLTVLGRRNRVNNERPIDLSGTDLRGAYLSGAHLSGAKLTGATLTGANLAGTHLSGANLAGATLSGANLAGAHLSGASLTGATLSAADLSGATLTRASLSGDLSGATLAGADLTGAFLAQANLSGAHLSGANLTGATLSGVNLTGASLSGVNLTGGTLTGGTLTGANLTGATLTRANLSEGLLSEGQLASARATDGIKWIGPRQQTG